jgi:hypothetical protein
MPVFSTLVTRAGMKYFCIIDISDNGGKQTQNRLKAKFEF